MKKLDVSALAPSTSSARPTHPTVTCDDPEMAALLEQFVIIAPQFKLLENQSKTLKGQLGPKIRSLFFNRFAGVTPESSTMLCTVGGKTIKLICKNAYTKTVNDEGALVAALGSDLVSKHFRQATVLKLELDKMPAELQEDFAAAVISLARTMGVTDGVSASQCIQPNPGFHEARTTLLTAEQNKALDAVLPITAYAMLS